jgi:Fe-S-cluster containining protein
MTQSLLTATVKVPGRRLKVARPAPAGPVRPDQLLPFMYAVDDAVIAVGVAQQRAAGRTITCSKGCDACCRAQPVPVTPAETLALARRVQALPAARQVHVRARFADGVARLREAGLFDTLMRDEPTTSPQQALAVTATYFSLGLACPFLEDGACSIHADRPFVCRQYLVSSPATLCADPLTAPVAIVPMPLRPVGAMLKAATAVAGRPQLTVPLMLALVYAERHRDELQRTADARTTLEAWLGNL